MFRHLCLGTFAMLVGVIFLCNSLSSDAQGVQKLPPFAHLPEETKVFELTNLERKKKNLPALTLNPLLSKIARGHSENMARQGRLEHKLDDKTVDKRMLDAGYKFMDAAENLAYGDKGAALADIMKDWMDSKGHRENILGDEYIEIGIGMARDKDGRMYFTQVFGTPLKD